MTDPYVVITLPGAPRGKGRHRSRIITPRGRKPFVSQYPDPETAAYEADLAAVARQAMIGLPTLDEALSLTVEAFVPVPASWSYRKANDALAGRIVPTGKPDADNYYKVVDALNGIVWRDDSLVVSGQVEKSYSATPCLRVSVWRWFEPEPEQPRLLGDFD